MASDQIRYRATFKQEAVIEIVFLAENKTDATNWAARLGRNQKMLGFRDLFEGDQLASGWRLEIVEEESRA